MDPKLITPLLMAALIAWGVYRRMRRSFGRQTVQQGRMLFRMILFVCIGVLVSLTALRNTDALAGLVAGIAAGAALAALGLRHTQFEVTPEGRYYTPHTYIGMIVTALFLGRVIYRLAAVYYLGHGLSAPYPGSSGYPGYAADAGSGPNPDWTAMYNRSPLTLAIFGALIGYYVLYYSGVLLKTRSLAAQPASASAPGAVERN